MAGPYFPGGQSHHGIKQADDHGHFPDEEILKQLGDRVYKLKSYERENLKNIERRIRSGENLSKQELLKYSHYLYHLSHEIKHILEFEKSDDLSNIPLEHDLRHIAQLLGEVSTILDRLK